MGKKEQTECRQCGTCCRKGGPALHQEDLGLLRRGVFGHRHLVTIRKGEFASNPAAGRLEPAPCELVKVNGRVGDWTCLFFVPETDSCSIYGDRPLECRLLKCWQPDEVLAAVGRDTVARADLVNQGDPVLDLIALQDQHCPAEAVEAALTGWLAERQNPARRAELTELVRSDLALRHHALTQLGLPDEVEFFVLGRPLFKQLAGFGVAIREAARTIDLIWPD